MPDNVPSPVAGKRNILITSALPYVNNVPHLGNIIGSTLSADVFARYCRGRGYQTLYICGTDEYGTATETQALKEGVSCQALCDKYFAKHDEIYKWFGLSFDKFGRTSTPAQTEIAQKIFLDLHRAGFLIEKAEIQLYCETHNAFLADRFVEGTCPKCGFEDARGDQCDGCGGLMEPKTLINPRCKVDGQTPVQRESTNMHIDLKRLQPEIEEWYKKTIAKGVWSKNGMAICESWFQKGLESRCITRDLKWGVPVPLEGWENKVFYVWFDAPIGYVSITANLTDDWESWWKSNSEGKPPVDLFHFLGKDNVLFHSTVFPGTQIGTRDPSWTKVNTISTTEYLQYEAGQKFSKSRQIGVFGDNAKDTGVAPDVWRYYLLSNRPESSDSQFSWRDFIAKNNSELLANFGNFVNRVLKFVNKQMNGTVPAYSKSFDVDWVPKVNEQLKLYIDDLENCRLRSGLARILVISGIGNLFLQDNKIDNKLLASDPETAGSVINFAVNLIYLLAVLAEPYLPNTAESIFKQLNKEPYAIPDEWNFSEIREGHKTGEPAHLFTRIDAKKEDEWRAKFGGIDSDQDKKDEKKAKKDAKKKAKKDKLLEKKDEKGTAVEEAAKAMEKTTVN